MDNQDYNNPNDEGSNLQFMPINTYLFTFATLAGFLIFY